MGPGAIVRAAARYTVWAGRALPGVPDAQSEDPTNGSSKTYALCFCVGPAAPAEGGRERPGRCPIRPGRAGNPHSRPGRGPRNILADGTDSKFVKFLFFDESDATSMFEFSRGS